MGRSDVGRNDDRVDHHDPHAPGSPGAELGAAVIAARRESAPATITAIIVDDEPLARDAIRVRLEREPGIVITGEATNGLEAVALIESLKPDIVFLDVKMPGLDGFAVIEKVSAVHLPIVVFVTAHDTFAIRAFERHALDYLLKPFTRERFAATINRVRVAVASAGEHETHERLVAMLDREHARVDRPDAAAGPSPYLVRLAVRRNGRIALVRVDDVEWIESSANYVRLHVGDHSHLVRMTMTELEQRLDPARFARIHRYTIVRIDCVKDIVQELHGDFSLSLNNGISLRLSRHYRSRLQL
jgi:two-component system LytT family response regulator